MIRVITVDIVAVVDHLRSTLDRLGYFENNASELNYGEFAHAQKESWPVLHHWKLHLRSTLDGQGHFEHNASELLKASSRMRRRKVCRSVLLAASE